MASKTQRELALLVTGRDVSATKTLKGVNKELNKLGAIAGKAGANVSRNIERGLVLGAGAAVGAIGFAVKSAMDFESSSASVRKTVDGNVTAILDANRALATHTGMEVNNLNEISATAGALGVAKRDITSFTKTVALLAVTTDDVTTELGATSLGHLKTTLNLAGQDFEHVGNTLVGLGNAGGSTEGQILAMTENIAGAANIMDASTPQVLGWAAALANTGEQAEAGGSSIQRFWLESFKSVQAGGKELKLMAKISGTSAAQFKKDFGKDATGTLAKFIVGLGKMSKAQQVATLDLLGFKDIRITRALLKLLGNTDNLTQSLKDGGRLWKENNAMNQEAATRFETTASKVEILKANVNDAAITIGQELLPVLADLSTDAVGWITDHRADIHDFALTLSHGIKDTVIWAKKLDWAAIGNALKAGADGAKFLVGAFMGAPPWLQQFLAVGFVANKFTGGAVQDVIGALGSGLIKGVLGMNAGVVNINAGVVNGAGGGAGLLPAAATAAGGSAAAALALPLALTAITAAVIAGVAINESNQNTTRGAAVQQTAAVFLEQSPSLSQLNTSLAGVDQGIADLRSMWGAKFVRGDALEQLEGTRQAILDQMTRATDDTNRTIAATDRAEANMTTAQLATAAATRDVRAGIEATRIAVQSKSWAVTVNNALTVVAKVSARNVVSQTTHQTLVARGAQRVQS